MPKVTDNTLTFKETKMRISAVLYTVATLTTCALANVMSPRDDTEKFEKQFELQILVPCGSDGKNCMKDGKGGALDTVTINQQKPGSDVIYGTTLLDFSQDPPRDDKAMIAGKIIFEGPTPDKKPRKFWVDHATTGTHYMVEVAVEDGPPRDWTIAWHLEEMLPLEAGRTTLNLDIAWIKWTVAPIPF